MPGIVAGGGDQSGGSQQKPGDLAVHHTLTRIIALNRIMDLMSVLRGYGMPVGFVFVAIIVVISARYLYPAEAKLWSLISN